MNAEHLPESSMKITLASKSAIRLAVLKGAGIPATPQGSGVDEDAIKSANRDAPVSTLAQLLADEKTLAVARKTDGIVIGGDQILSVDGTAYDKVSTLSDARQRLLMLKGREHQLVGALTIAVNGEITARNTTISTLIMRDFSDQFLDAYLDQDKDHLLGSVGCYRLEGPGAQLFQSLEGDYFSILGIDLLWLVGELLALGAVVECPWRNISMEGCWRPLSSVIRSSTASRR